MLLARGSGDDPDGWLWALAAVALYAVITYGLTYRARVRRGSAHPARDAVHDLKDREDSQPARQRHVSRLIMLGGALVVGLAALLTSGPLRIVVVGLAGAATVVAWAYYDFRTARRTPAPQ
jgi:membrane protein implicated in regulation of membrane protease activity